MWMCGTRGCARTFCSWNFSVVDRDCAGNMGAQAEGELNSVSKHHGPSNSECVMESVGNLLDPKAKRHLQGRQLLNQPPGIARRRVWRRTDSQIVFTSLHVLAAATISGDERCGGGGELGNSRVSVAGGDEIVELCHRHGPRW
uniref:Uncharacterized protein n=2 Tax=Physcomitrium patens TaxID=3218 RepID=A9TJ82_PHYPA|nr:hypothetical protein PHYPA_020346 [Physcomitrium patens]